MIPPAIPVTFFTDYAARLKREEPLAPHELARRIKEMVAPEKARLPWLKLARFGSIRSDKNSLRHDANVLAIGGIEADYDGARISFDEAVEIAEKIELACIVYTSPSHTITAPRWRVLCPTSRELPPSDRDVMMARLNGLYRGVFSGESWTLSQSYYFGRVAGSRDHRVEILDGTCIDLLDELDEIAIWKQPNGRTWSGTAGAEEDARYDAELVRRVVTGEGFHMQLLALAARYIGRGIGVDTVAALLTGLMLAHPEASRDARWHDRYGSIGGLVQSAQAKYGAGVEGRRAIARVTHRMVRRRYPADEIRALVLREAEQRGIAPEAAVAIASAILRDKVARGRHA